MSRLQNAGTLLALVLAATALAGCGSGGTSSTTFALPEGCAKAPAPHPKRVHLHPPRGADRSAAARSATVITSCGRFSIALDPSAAPKTVASFAFLARKGVYDRTSFGRMVPGFLIQGGDPTETGS